MLPGAQVVMLTASTEEDAIIDAVVAGASGYVQKYAPPEKLVDTILHIAEGEMRIPDGSIPKIFEFIRGAGTFRNRPVSHKLTAVERKNHQAVCKRSVLHRNR